MNHEGVYRTAPATPGLLISVYSSNMSQMREKENPAKRIFSMFQHYWLLIVKSPSAGGSRGPSLRTGTGSMPGTTAGDICEHFYLYINRVTS